jgi:hypothetical protein
VHCLARATFESTRFETWSGDADVPLVPAVAPVLAFSSRRRPANAPPIGAADRRARRLRRKHCTKIEGATLGKRFERLLPSDTETRLRASGSGAAGVPDEGEPIRAYPGQRTRRRRQGLDELYGRTNAPAVIATVTTCSFSMSPTLNCQRSSSLLNPRPLLRCRQSRRQSVTYSREA